MARSRGASAILDARYDAGRDAIDLQFRGGGSMMIPRQIIPGLKQAPASVLGEPISISPAGDALSWPSLDLDIYIPGLVERAFGAHLFAAATGRQTGRTRSKAKETAAKAHGAKSRRQARRLRVGNAWKIMDDPANIENRNAGNGGDLVKHTVYLSTLRFLLTHEPWSQGLYLRECHAGRGIYHIPNGDARCRLLSCLYSNPASTDTILLQSNQSRILGALGCWPDVVEGLQWYAGSALINAFALADAHPGLHTLDLYEQQPQTRRILRSVLTNMNFQARLSVSVLSGEEQDQEFDGEAHIEDLIGGWGKRDVVLLDPFAMWRQSHHQRQRDRYGAIVDGILRRGADAPSLILFWTWGQNHTVAKEDLDGPNKPVKPVQNGYKELRDKFHNAECHFVRVKWCWGLTFAMWVAVPQKHLATLRDHIDKHCRLLSDHLVQHGCGVSPVTVTID